MTEIIPIGVGSAVPVKGRGFSCVALRRPESVLLFDCGEATQLRLLETDIKMSRIEVIAVSHLHGDHFFGLMGLLATMSLLHRASALTVVGPEGIRGLIESMPGLSPEEMNYGVRFIELADNDRRTLAVDAPGYRLWSRRLDHGVPSFGFRYEESRRSGNLDVERARRAGVVDPRDFGRLKSGESVRLADGSVVKPETVVSRGTAGAVFAYVTDTRPCDAATVLATEADILFHEATFTDSHSERADATGHSTASQAAGIARDARVRRLLLSHFSARYRRTDDLVDEAREIFSRAEAAEEFTRYALQSTVELTSQP